MTQIDRLDSGQDVTRVSTAAADQAIRAERDRRAMAYLERTGNQDLAEVLGLVPSAPPKRTTKPRVSREVTPPAAKSRKARR